MAEKAKQGKFHACIDEIENGFEVSCRHDRKPTLSQKAGWIGESYQEPKKYTFKTVEEVLKHIKSEA